MEQDFIDQNKTFIEYVKMFSVLLFPRMCTNFISQSWLWQHVRSNRRVSEQNVQTMLIKVGAEKGNLLSV